jgi:hypothetical protein
MMQNGMFTAPAPAGVTCPWCKHYWPAGMVAAECANCGGALPAPPGPTRAAEPPAIPRRLPQRYTNDLLGWKNVGAIVGTVFAAFGALFAAIGVGLCFVLLPLGLGFFGFGALFGTIGWLLRSASRKSALRQIDALTRGHVAEGQLVGVRQDFSESINGRHPYRIEYVFYVNGQPLGGSTSGWDIVNALRQPGEPLWVVFLPENPSINSIWPPIA